MLAKLSQKGDLTYWVIALALLSVVKGLLQAALACTVLQHTIKDYN